MQGFLSSIEPCRPHSDTSLDPAPLPQVSRRAGWRTT